MLKWEKQFGDGPLRASGFEFAGHRYVAAQTPTGTHIYREADVETFLGLIEDSDIQEVLCCDGQTVWDYLEPVQSLTIAGLGKGIFVDNQQGEKPSRQ